MGQFSTIITGTVLATGKSFTHGLGTTPDFVFAVPSQASCTQPIGVLTYDQTYVVLTSALDGTAFRCLVMKLHSLVN